MCMKLTIACPGAKVAAVCHRLSSALGTKLRIRLMIRASTHFYTTEEEVDQLVGALPSLLRDCGA